MIRDRVVRFCKWTVNDEAIREDDTMTFKRSILLHYVVLILTWVVMAISHIEGDSVVFFMMLWVFIGFSIPTVGLYLYLDEEEQ